MTRLKPIWAYKADSANLVNSRLQTLTVVGSDHEYRGKMRFVLLFLDVVSNLVLNELNTGVAGDRLSDGLQLGSSDKDGLG
jgi:hypothetical protein